MKIGSLSIVIGDGSCNAHCPFCVSRMTGKEEAKDTELNYQNLRVALELTQLGGTTTTLITGKGEPTLHPDKISMLLGHLYQHYGAAPIVELQTNGIILGRAAETYDEEWSERLSKWKEKGLNTIAISITSIKQDELEETYCKDYPNLETTIEYLHNFGYTIRLCLMLTWKYTSTWQKLKEIIDFCRKNEVEQFTTRNIRAPSIFKDTRAAEWVSTWKLPQNVELAFLRQIERLGHKIMLLPHGTVYDIDGQNVCVSDCLTCAENRDELRQLIFYENGRLTYDWQYAGAILLRGNT